MENPKINENHCKFYGSCGGCSFSLEEVVTKNKADFVTAALAKYGIEAEVLPVINAFEGGRRRVSLHKRDGKFGFSRRKSNEIIAIDSCPILAEPLQKALKLATNLSFSLTSDVVDCHITLVEAGLDVSLTSNKPLNSKERAKFLALDEKPLRLTVNGELVLQTGAVEIYLDDVKVPFPTNSFLQATKVGEIALQNEVLKAIKKEKNILDLFAGLGTFTLPLLKKSSVKAIEWEQDALTALQTAFNFAKGLKPMHLERRDLWRMPLLAKEFRDYDAVIIDPPRNGAEKQMHQIALSPMKKVISVSCNPETFARDAKILIDKGFVFESIQPFDQFHYSDHVEVVGVLKRK